MQVIALMSVMIPAYAHRNDVGCGNRMATQRHRGGEAGRPPVDASSGQALLPKKHRRKMLRAVGGWLCRGRCKTRFDTKKRASWREMESELPESPATVQLSRANSESSTETEIEEEDLSGDNSKRVTFHMEITVSNLVLECIIRFSCCHSAAVCILSRIVLRTLKYEVLIYTLAGYWATS